MSSEAIVKALLAGTEFDDPRLYSLLDKVITDLYSLNNQINPPSGARIFGATGQVASPTDVTGFMATLFNNNVKLNWDAITGINTFELRYIAGSKNSTYWGIASTILRTSTLSADINPLTIPLIFGDHTFLIKSLSNSGVEADTASYIVINVPIIQAPVITPVVINNFVLLNWTNPASVFLIDHYNIYKNGSFVGRVSGTFEAIFETTGGTFSYIVEPVDIVGNIGTASPALSLIVSNPVDFTLHATLTSTFTGAKVSSYAYTDLSVGS